MIALSPANTRRPFILLNSVFRTMKNSAPNRFVMPSWSAEEEKTQAEAQALDTTVLGTQHGQATTSRRCLASPRSGT